MFSWSQPESFSASCRKVTGQPANRWKRQAVTLHCQSANPGLDDLVLFVQSAAKEVSDSVYGHVGTQSKTRQTDTPTTVTTKRGFHGATVTLTSESGVRKPCPACDCCECRTLFKCDRFRQMKPEERFDLARWNRLCYNYLKSGHPSRECKAETTCNDRGCKIKHTNFLVHIVRHLGESGTNSQSVTRPPEEQKSPSASAVCSHVSGSSTLTVRVTLPVVKVNVTVRNGVVQTYALLDSGSTNTFCTSSLLKRLKPIGQKAAINVTTLRSQGDQLLTSVHDLEISDVAGNNRVVVHQAYATQSIPVSRDCIVTLKDMQEWKHLTDLPIPELQDAPVEIHVGQDCLEILMPL